MYPHTGPPHILNPGFPVPECVRKEGRDYIPGLDAASGRTLGGDWGSWQLIMSKAEVLDIMCRMKRVEISVAGTYFHATNYSNGTDTETVTLNESFEARRVLGMPFVNSYGGQGFASDALVEAEGDWWNERNNYLGFYPPRSLY